jgi:hypothetical protein
MPWLPSHTSVIELRHPDVDQPIIYIHKGYVDYYISGQNILGYGFFHRLNCISSSYRCVAGKHCLVLAFDSFVTECFTWFSQC